MSSPAPPPPPDPAAPPAPPSPFLQPGEGSPEEARRASAWRRAELAFRSVWGLMISGWLHLVPLAVFLLGGRSCLGLNGGDVFGEKGQVGAGGPELEISLYEEKDPEPPSAPPTPPVPLAPPAPPPAPPTPPKPPKEKSDEGLEKPDESDAPPPEPPRPRRPTMDNVPPGPEKRAAKSNGRAPGDANSISSQRGRLSVAVECDDPVAGVWMSSIYDARRSQWYIFTLQMRHDGGQLSGSIESHFWDGLSRQTRPPSCDETDLHAIVSMPGSGSTDGRRVVFGSSSWRLQRLICGSPGQLAYSPDSFSGTIDAGRNEFKSLASDGQNFINEPMLFRRVRCLD
ncbi:MAG TPA: hypothetical protein VFS43_25565 [Polyangiaceae bacterium]|nr:hypothetical protein [Polyangiaceae bacterium]